MSIAAVHAELDARIAVACGQSAALGRPITCRGAGCSACCIEPVLISREEAAWLIAGLSPEERERVTARTARWLTQVRASGLLKETSPHVALWRMIRAWCPLLEDGRCVAYERRPISCRLHLAIDDPALCADDRGRMVQTYMVCPEVNTTALAMELEDSATGRIENDHLGVWLSALLLGKRVVSAAHGSICGYIEDLPDGTQSMTMDGGGLPQPISTDTRV